VLSHHQAEYKYTNVILLKSDVSIFAISMTFIYCNIKKKTFKTLLAKIPLIV
jgi:hypothetical protein